MCEAAAIAENIISNTCHRIRNRDGGETIARSESTISNTCHRIRNRDGGEAAASKVFANSFISTSCNLNGRKVIVQILQRLEKMQI